LEKDDITAKMHTPVSANTPENQLYTQVVECRSDSTLLVFTNKGNMGRILLDEMECQDHRSSGMKLDKLFEDAEKGERPVKLFAYTGTLPEGDILFFTKDGTVKRSHWSEYDAGNKRWLPALKLKDGDSVVNVETFDPDEFSTMLFVTQKGMALNANKDEVPVQGRMAGGVRGMVLNDGDSVLTAFQHNGEGEVIIVSQAGTFKRVVSSLLDQLPRARKGVLIADRTKGDVIFADYVTIPYAVVVVGKDKAVKEINTEDISIESRVSKGKPMKEKGITDVDAVYALNWKTLM
jgi:DNA gyrase/topoisomerase IV subunit A